MTSPDIPQSFLDNLSLILDAGVFEVRGGSGDATTSAAAYLSVGGRTLAAPHWGVEPHPTWPTDGHFLVYGYPTLNPNTVIDPATNLNTNGPTTYNSFEIGTLPDSHAKTPPVGASWGMLVGVCYNSVTGTTAANRLIHNNFELFDNTPPTFCSTPVASLESVKLVRPCDSGRGLPVRTEDGQRNARRRIVHWRPPEQLESNVHGEDRRDERGDGIHQAAGEHFGR